MRLARPLCDVVILAWNKCAVTKKCVDSLVLSTDLPIRVIIIDNASTDETPAYLESLQNTETCIFSIITNKENNGFVGGMNQGMALTTAPYVCLANNDLIFTRGWLDEVLAVFNKNPSIGVLNPGSNNLGAKLPPSLSLEEFARARYAERQGQFVELSACIGFCMVIKREVIDRVGGLSDEFAPMFFEDTDYSRKASAAGFLIGVAQGAFVWHDEHVSVNALGTKKQEYFDASKQTFEKKWGAILRVALVVFGSFPIDNLKEVLLLCARSGMFVTVFRRKRKNIESTDFLYNHSGIRNSTYWNVFSMVRKILFKKKRFHVIVTSSSSLRFVVRLFGYVAYPTLNEVVAKLKQNGSVRGF